MPHTIQGFSRLTKDEKIAWLTSNFLSSNPNATQILKQYWNDDQKLQQLHDEFIENTISNYYLPLGIAPNFIINNKSFAIPMAIEESSVVAAASKAAKFWMSRGGFKAEILGTEKIGQVHFTFSGDSKKISAFFEDHKAQIIEDLKPHTESMERRGGGLKSLELINRTNTLEHYYQLHATFETLDAMGANFINTCLEQIAESWQRLYNEKASFKSADQELVVIMSILSNYVPGCVVRAEVSCPVSELSEADGIDPQLFANKFVQAVRIAEVEPYRAVTHNKGIMNGIDAVVLATGNDFRAIEAAAHAYAAKDGSYSSLTHATIEDGIFKFWIEIPLALGTVGGLTKLHPLVKLNLEMLGNPSAPQLMEIIAVAGLAQNFGAVKSLTTTGIQKGHMKMHLMNMLNQFEASEEEKNLAIQHFKTNKVTYSAVGNLITNLRKSAQNA
ncbi:hydroxymethylglutaryl-CoA reductase, degradative [Leeuwenhoekiella palythoae]|uniref:hydroxymethylglutaryl-CoA reductase, degradative n=1 Tax=Leeuwenhoekiella palythoae TaxID=573501 RepID=UPI000E867018|nr:hydroxymethylglutaryl-CoA reductase, degradative [Leeuwenhoekiella palythoae]UBZ09266.1 hydroxymethylglutaryl-CoA reductase, degradative [Leeuwenhoekiella palythoae]HAX14895.1 hydroxymethylglutaryl-CoA reductase, degradative [Leeuwenhoekiella sp.]HBO30714.1 hydroxymethylglutaryl-CoA reductase, degradative [Leeuwenhoekiella sp.]